MPPTCQDSFAFALSLAPHEEDVNGINSTDSICNSSVCDVDVDQDAHRINLSVFRDNVLFAEDSVYVPGVGESESHRYRFGLLNGLPKLQTGWLHFNGLMCVSDLEKKPIQILIARAGLPGVSDLQNFSLEGNIEISWKAPVQPVRRYVIDYTHDGENYHWKETEFTNATLSGRCAVAWIVAS